MSLEAFNKLNNIRTLKALLRDEVDYETFEQFSLKVLEALEERKKDFEAQKAQEQAQLDFIENMKKLAEEQGFDFNQIINNTSEVKQRKERKKQDPRPAKYEFTDAEGNLKTWTGQGRTPRELAGKNLEDFLINK